MENQIEDQKKQEIKDSEKSIEPRSPGRGRVNIEVKASFELDDARIFDLNGEGLTITAVTSN